MDETLNEIYRQLVASHDRGMRLVENRLQFSNWLFGVSSATLFGALAILNTSESFSVEFILRFDLSALVAGCVAFSGVIFTYMSKREGYRSIEAILMLLTFIDVQVAILLKGDNSEESQSERVVKFLQYEYLDDASKEKTVNFIKMQTRKYNDIYWLRLLTWSVVIALLFLLISMIQTVVLGNYETYWY